MTIEAETSEHNNASFAFEYTQKMLEKINRSIDVVTTKLTALLAFGGVILKFAETLSDQKWLVWAKITVCVLTTLAAISCAVGLSPSSAGEAIDPEELLEPHIYRMSDEECKVFVTRQALKSINSLEQLLEKRLRSLNLAIVLIVLSGIGIALSISVKGLGI